MRNYGYILCWFIITTFFFSLEAFNRSLFFRTSSFWDEPRFERPWLTSIDLSLQGGSSHLGHDGCSRKTQLFAIYGPENIKALAALSPIDNPLKIPNNPSSICFNAIADVFESNFNLYQNLTLGFFTQFHLPLIFVHIFPSGFKENCHHSPIRCKHDKNFRPGWHKSQAGLASFLKDFDLSLISKEKFALSDSTLFFGWTHSFEDTEYLDFIDLTLKTGVLFPTGKKANLKRVFDFPYGYNGHWGLPISGDLSFGVYDWLTLGIHADSLFLFKKKQCVRMKLPGEAPTGFITLGKGFAEVDPGTVWRTGGYIKADHFFRGLSLLMAFSYERQNRTHLVPCDREQFSLPQVNRAERLKSWSRSIFHFLGEYDFAHGDSCVGPRMGFFIDHQINGKRVFDIHMSSGYVGIDVNWCY